MGTSSKHCDCECTHTHSPMQAPRTPVEAGCLPELGPQLRGQRQALLLAGKLEQVGALPHDRGSTGGHLENLLLGGLPGDDVELLLLRRARASEGEGGPSEWE